MTSTSSTRSEAAEHRDTRPLARYFLRLGATGFGGPVALVAAMHRDLVERRGWFTESEYRQGIMLAQVSPGPLAAQLCFYLAFIQGGLKSALLSAAAFVGPGFFMVAVIGWAYVRFGGLPQIRAVFYGVGAAVAGILVHSSWKLARKTIGTEWLLLALAAATATITVVTGKEPVPVIVAAGVVAWIARVPPAWIRRAGTANEAASMILLLQIALFFTYAGAFVFGSGLAIVPFLHSGLVVNRGWLDETQFLDAVAVALITPGPAVITTGFVGYIVAGLPGAVVAAAATFVPCFGITVLLAPQVERYARSRSLAAVAAGITAAATGALAGAVVLVCSQTVHDATTLVVAVVAAVAAWSRRVPEPALIAMAAAVGLFR